MKLKIESVIRLINITTSENNYTGARKLINSEWDRITETKNYLQLNSNAQQLVKIIKLEKEKGSFDVLSDSDKKILNLVNEYIKNLQFHFARRIYSEHQSLFDKPEAQSWLTSDAKSIYAAWKKSL